MLIDFRGPTIAGVLLERSTFDSWLWIQRASTVLLRFFFVYTMLYRYSVAFVKKWL
jgi:hypothetical protein